MNILLPLLLAISTAAELTSSLEFGHIRAQQVTDDAVVRASSDSNARSVICERPSNFCTDEYFSAVYETRDCDGDGTLDHKCTTSHGDRMWLVLSTEGCPAKWGTSKRQQSECKAAFAIETPDIHSRLQQISDVDRQEIPDTAPLSEDGYREVAALEDDEAMLKFAHRQLDALGLRARTESDLRGWVPWFSGTKAKHNYSAMVDSLQMQDLVFRAREVPNIVPLSEDGYQQVAALEDDEAMLKFVRRQLDALGLRARTEGDLRGWVPWFSGTKAKQNLAAMIGELTTQDWVFRTDSARTYAAKAFPQQGK